MIHPRIFRYGFAIVVVALAARAARAQFGTVINIPPDPNTPDHGAIGSGTQRNLKGGGKVDISFDAGATNGTGINGRRASRTRYLLDLT